MSGPEGSHNRPTPMGRQRSRTWGLKGQTRATPEKRQEQNRKSAKERRERGNGEEEKIK